MAPTKRIEQWEIDRYWDIFSGLSNGSTHLDGNQAASVLKNSQLRDDQLERIWDLADVDNDGRLDFEEFCVAMRLIFDLVNGEYTDVPQYLPDWMVPESKAHLISASKAITGNQRPFDPIASDHDSEPDTDANGNTLRSDFDWYMSPSDKSKYGEIYSANRDGSGGIEFAALEPLYESLDVPDTDIRSAWNLINPRSEARIGKDATMAFLHILNQRHEGIRVPRSVPPSLSSSFTSTRVDHRVESYGSNNTASSRVSSSSAAAAAAARRWGVDTSDSDTPSSRKAAFGDAYLSRLGLGDRAKNRPKGTDFERAKTDDEWEEVRLRKQLRGLEEKLSRMEDVGRSGSITGGHRNRGERTGGKSSSDANKPALVRRELEQLLDWKRRELGGLISLDGSDQNSSSASAQGQLTAVREDIVMVKEQIDGLEAHLKKREGVLEDLRAQISAERTGR